MPAIDARLNFVIPIYDGEGDTTTIRAHVFAAPISRAVFETHYIVLSKTFAAIMGDGYGSMAGPRIAALLLRTVAEREYGKEDALQQVAPLLQEIRRLTNVLVCENNEWAMIPYETARANPTILSPDDVSEVDNTLVFFTSVSAMLKRNVLRHNLEWAAKMWAAQVSSLSIMEYRASLLTSTPAATSSPIAEAPALAEAPAAIAEAAAASVRRPLPGPTVQMVGSRASLPV